MSAEATGWVYRHSPYKGATFQVHHAIADSVNDQHDYELWMRQGVLAKKARTTRKTVNDAIDTMVTAGLLEFLEAGKGGANRYRFLMPDVPVIYESRFKGGVTRGDTPVTGGVTLSALPVTTGDKGGVTRGDTEPKGFKPKTPISSRCPEPFFITSEMHAWAEDSGITLDLREVTREFVDYWRGVPGARGVKADWPATWRNWLRKNQRDASERRGRRPRTEPVRYDHELDYQ